MPVPDEPQAESQEESDGKSLEEQFLEKQKEKFLEQQLEVALRREKQLWNEVVRALDDPYNQESVKLEKEYEVLLGKRKSAEISFSNKELELIEEKKTHTKLVEEIKKTKKHTKVDRVKLDIVLKKIEGEMDSEKKELLEERKLIEAQIADLEKKVSEIGQKKDDSREELDSKIEIAQKEGAEDARKMFLGRFGRFQQENRKLCDAWNSNTATRKMFSGGFEQFQEEQQKWFRDEIEGGKGNEKKELVEKQKLVEAQIEDLKKKVYEFGQKKDARSKIEIPEDESKMFRTRISRYQQDERKLYEVHNDLKNADEVARKDVKQMFSGDLRKKAVKIRRKVDEMLKKHDDARKMFGAQNEAEDMKLRFEEFQQKSMEDETEQFRRDVQFGKNQFSESFLSFKQENGEFLPDNAVEMKMFDERFGRLDRSSEMERERRL